MPEDCRALFEPIDYVAFAGLSRTGRVERLGFLDVKTGGAGLNRHQKAVKEAVEKGAVEFRRMA